VQAERLATLARVRALTDDFDGIVAGAADMNGDDEHDPEGSTIAYERAQVTALLDQARAHLDDLDRASAKLAAGTYGVCDRCGAEIAADRLAARPAALTCIGCAALPPPV
jgi:RNA polymerase-binding transcription factor